MESWTPMLGQHAATGRPCRWIAVRRIYNRAADDAATAGCNVVAHAARIGRRHMFASVRMH
eukprot:8548043-Lingulodinium_polyedra.AAC.1